MRIALVVDHPQRDLPGLVLLAGRLCDTGATCYLVPLDLHRRELTALAPDLAVLNYLRRNDQELAGPASPRFDYAVPLACGRSVAMTAR